MDDNIHDMTALQYISHHSPAVASSHSPFTNNLKGEEEKKRRENPNDMRNLILQNERFRGHHHCPIKDTKAIRNAPPSDPFSKPAQERKVKKGKEVKKRKE